MKKLQNCFSYIETMVYEDNYLLDQIFNVYKNRELNVLQDYVMNEEASALGFKLW